MSELESAVTIRQIAGDIYRLYGVDMQSAVQIFESVVYGNLKIGNEQVSQMYNVYENIKTSRDEILKNRKKLRKAG